MSSEESFHALEFTIKTYLRSLQETTSYLHLLLRIKQLHRSTRYKF